MDFVLSWQTSLLCIVGELAGGGSVAVAVGVSERWQVIHFFFLFFLNFFVMVLVLLTAYAKRFSVSRMRDFFFIFPIEN